MPVVASCRCGQQFLAEDFLIGRHVPCPQCGNLLAIGTPVAAAPAPVPPGIVVSCTCGSQFLAPASLRGKAGRCGACGAVVSVPAFVDPLVAAATRPPQPAILRAPAAEEPDRTALIAGLAVAGVLVLGVLIALIAGSFSRGNPDGNPAGELLVQGPPAPPPAAPTPLVSVAPSARATSSPLVGSPRTQYSPTPSPDATTDIGAPDASLADSPDFGQPIRASVGSGRLTRPTDNHSIDQLPAALQAWHSRPNIKLAGILAGGDPENPVTHLSWMTSLLPHLGYVEEYQRLQLGQPITHAANLRVGHTVIPEFQNPLDSRKTWEGYPFHGLALTHFVGMSGVEDARSVCAAQLPRSDPRAGIFGYDEVAGPDKITDGTSHTIMIVGGGRLASPWLLGGGATIRGAREPLFDGISGLGAQGLPTAGTIAVMADGSVRTIPKSIDPSVFRAMCTIHGAESVDLEAAAPELPIQALHPAGR